MKKFLSLVFLVSLSTFTLLGQPAEEVDTDKVVTLNGTIETLYAVISGEKGETRDWDRFKYLFHPGAKLIPAQKNEEEQYRPSYLTPDEYVERAGTWLVENGFFEKEIHRVENTFGNITHVFSTYESYRSEGDDRPFARGINSIQLLNDGERWWIINIYWMSEAEDNPIPNKYLPKG